MDLTEASIPLLRSSPSLNLKAELNSKLSNRHIVMVEFSAWEEALMLDHQKIVQA